MFAKHLIKEFALVVWLIWCLVCSCRTAGTVPDQITLCGILFIYSTYLFARSLSDKRLVVGSIAIAGCIQAVVAILQSFSLVDVNHDVFTITGLLGNPGQLGGFQSVALVCAVSFLHSVREIRWVVILLCVVTLILVSLVLSDSRAGILAAIMGSLVLSYDFWIKYLSKHKLLWLLGCGLFVLFTLLLYSYRPESAESRFLVWRVCLNMFADKPIAGFGIWGFNHNYMLYQGEYLLSHPDHTMYFRADNVTYPYNEAIRVLVEQGLVGFILVCTVFAINIKGAKEKRDIAALISLVVFSMFSYPSYKVSLVLLFPLLLGTLSSLPFKTRECRKAFSMVSFGIAVICIAFIGATERHFMHKVSQVYENGYVENDEINRLFVRNKNCIDINASYSTLIKHIPEFLNQDTVPLIFPSSDNWCVLGDYYLSNGNLNEAERYFIQASHMTPGLVIPKYSLWKTYNMQMKKKESQCVAGQILKMSVKVENTLTLRLRNEVLNYDYSSFEK